MKTKGMWSLLTISNYFISETALFFSFHISPLNCIAHTYTHTCACTDMILCSYEMDLEDAKEMYQELVGNQ